MTQMTKMLPILLRKLRCIDKSPLGLSADSAANSTHHDK